MKRSDIDRMTLSAPTWGERQYRSPHPPLASSPKRMIDTAEGSCEAGGNLMQIERDTSMIILLISFFF